MRRRHEIDQIAPRTGLAAGEMNLQHAERRRLADTRAQVAVSSSVGTRIERERIGAIRTAERAAVRQLGKEAERLVQRHGWHVRHSGARAARARNPYPQAAQNSKHRR